MIEACRYCGFPAYAGRPGHVDSALIATRDCEASGNRYNDARRLASKELAVARAAARIQRISAEAEEEVAAWREFVEQMNARPGLQVTNR